MSRWVQDWRYRAACRDTTPELFFPAGEGDAARNQVAQAKLVCSHCPVREACLAWAVGEGQQHGVWGGLSEGERKALRRRTQRQQAQAA